MASKIKPIIDTKEKFEASSRELLAHLCDLRDKTQSLIDAVMQDRLAVSNECLDAMRNINKAK